jgi:replicative DNA helicase
MKDDVDLVIIDHLHYIPLESANENQELGKVMRSLKIMTDVMKKPVVLVSHVRKRSKADVRKDLSISDLY